MKSKKTPSPLEEITIDDEELPEGWTLNKLDYAGQWLTGGTPSRSKPEYFNGTIPWVKITDLNDGIVYSTEDKISELGLQNSAAKLLPVGTICVGIYGSIGKIGILGTQAATNQACGNCIVDETKVNSKFLYYYILSQRSDLLSRGRGGTQANINNKILRDWPLPLPPLTEQQRIVARVESLLSHVNAARDKIKRVPLIMKKFRLAVLTVGCSGRLTEEWREEHENKIQSPSLDDILIKRKLLWEERTSLGNSISQRKNRQKYKEPKGPIGDNIEDLPSCWIPITISQLAILDVGFSFSSQNFQNSGIRLLRGENIEPGSLRWIDTKYWSTEQIEDYHHLFLEKGEIVLGMDRPLISAGLKIARVKQDDLPCLLVQRVTRFKMIEPEYTDLLYYNLLTEKFRKYLSENGLTGSALPHITGSAVAEFSLALPSKEEAIEIVRRVSILLERADAFDQEVAAAGRRCERLTQSVLGKAFAGKL